MQRRYINIIAFLCLLLCVLATQLEGQSYSPPLVCPANTVQIAVVDNAVEILKNDAAISYPVNLPFSGNATLIGWRKVGHPEVGCTPDNQPDSNWMCVQTDQQNEEFYVSLDGNTLGLVEDVGENQWATFQFSLSALSTGSHTFTMEHSHQGATPYESVAYIAALCLDNPTTSVPTVTPDGTDAPPVPTEQPPSTPYVPFDPPDTTWCEIVNLPLTVPANQLLVYGHEMVSWDTTKNAYVIFALDYEDFPAGTRIPITLPDGTLFAIVTLMPDFTCIPDEAPETALLLAEEPCIGCPPHQDEVLVLDENGNYSMVATIWSSDGMMTVAASTAPIGAICENAYTSIVNTVKGTPYYVLWSLGSCVFETNYHRYEPCTLTPDTTHPYWLGEDGNVLIFPSQVAGELQAAYDALEVDGSGALYHLAHTRNWFTGAGWYALQ